MKPILFVLICLFNIVLDSPDEDISASQEKQIDVNILTEHGAITVALYPNRAPVTVANFLRYVEAGYYDGGSFFRTVHDQNQPDSPVKITVIQGGAMESTERFDPIPLERTSKTGIKHKDGTISMARAEPNTAQDSFFICIDDQPELDFGGKRNPDGQGFAAFGQVFSGMDVVRKINEAPYAGQTITPTILISEVIIVQ